MVDRKQRRRFTDSQRGETTILGAGQRFTGRFEGAGSMIVSGEVDGECELDGSVTIANSGSWKGSVQAGDVVIAGRLEGDVQAAGRVEIGKTAHVNATLTGAFIAVADGAIIEGQMRITSAGDVKRFDEKRAAEPAPGAAGDSETEPA